MSLRTRLASAVAALALAVSGVAATAPTAQAAPYCGITWGSLARSSAPMSTATMTNVRAGRHACYDRLIIDLNGTARTGYDVRYVSNVHADGSGALVPLRGGAKIRIIAKAPAHDGLGRATYRPANQRELVNVAGFSTFRQVAWAGSFEGQTTVGLGVRARLPFRVFTLTDSTARTTRLVIDVAHRW
ncbi:MAG: hypothetical protein ABR500_09115 [Dermatophilaceae bacterium]